MTRKEYIRKMRELLVATYNHPDIAAMMERGAMKKNALGTAFKYLERSAKGSAANYGSYEAAWESALPCRKHYMGDGR